MLKAGDIARLEDRRERGVSDEIGGYYMHANM